MRFSPRSAARSLLVGAVALSGSVAIGLTPAGTAALGLVVAVTPLVVPGTGTPNPQDSNNYMANAVAYYVQPSGSCGAADCAEPVAVPTSPSSGRFRCRAGVGWRGPNGTCRWPAESPG